MDLRLRRLISARVIGSASLVALGQLAVNMPEGYFGPTDRVSWVGALVAAAASLAAVGIVLGLHRERAWAPRLAAGFHLVALLLFLPALPADTAVAGGVVGWNLLNLLRHLFPSEPAAGRPGEVASGAQQGLARWMADSEPAVLHLTVLAILATVATVGFRLGTGWLAQATCWLLQIGAAIGGLRLVWLLWRSGSRLVLLVPLPLLLAPIFITQPTLSFSLATLFQLLVLLLLVTRTEVFGELMASFFRRPLALAVLTFAGLILMGTVMLSFPAAYAAGRIISPLDALFTATSAVCVTGLTVLDTATAFSTFGQGVILGLIQVGGLGIMVLSTFATVLLGGRLGIRGGQALSQLLELRGPRDAYRLTLFIVNSTLAIEAAGGAALTLIFLKHGFGLGEAIWRGCFHAISAFCNAGFALQSDSLLMFREDPLALLVIALLITAGGFGFLVLAASWSRLRRRPIGHLAVQVRVVLWTSGLLLLFGFLLIAALEWNATLRDLSPGHKLMNAFFQSVTLRTAGFNSVSFTGLTTATLLMMLLLMFVGASPGGTGGGIKTTTLAVLFHTVRGISRGEARVVIKGRTIPQEIVYRSVAILVISVAMAFVGLAVLALLQPQPVEALAFEVFSALGTVGLSLDVTPKLTAAGKLVIGLLMFVGRVGPLSLALLLGRRTEARIEYPATNLMVG